MCPGCESTEGFLNDQEEFSRGVLLKVSSTLYSEYCHVCRELGLNPEPGCNFESDDDISINIQILKERIEAQTRI